ncbi:MAG: hypothetical protein ABEH56_01950 [Salinirussus sp.]
MSGRRSARPSRLFLVGATVLLAGCAGLFGGGGTPTQSLTPAPVPTTEPAPAPGVSAGGQVDTSVVLAANNRTLRNSSYRFERRLRIEGTNSTLDVTRIRRVRANGTGIERLDVDGTGLLSSAVRNWTLWYAGGVVWQRATLAEGRTVRNRLLPDTDGRQGPFDFGRSLARQVFAASELRIAARGPGGVVLESVRPFDVPERVLPLVIGPPRNATATVVVTDRGVIRNVTMRYDAPIGGETVTVRLQQRISDVGATTATRPAWVPVRSARPGPADPTTVTDSG